MFRITINSRSFLQHITGIKSIFCQENSTNSMKSHIKTSKLKHKIYINSKSSCLLNPNLNSNSKYCGLPFSIRKQKRPPILKFSVPWKNTKTKKFRFFIPSPFLGESITNQPNSTISDSKRGKKEDFFFLSLQVSPIIGLQKTSNGALTSNAAGV